MKTEASGNHSKPKVILLTASLLIGAAGIGGMSSWPLLLPSAMTLSGWTATHGAVMLLAMGIVAAVSGTFLSVIIRPGAIPLVSFAASGVMIGGGLLVNLSQTLISITIGAALVGGATGAFLACVGLISSGRAKNSQNGSLIFIATSGLGLSLLVVAVFVPMLINMTGNWLLAIAAVAVAAALGGIAAGSFGFANRGLLRGLASETNATEPSDWSDQWSVAAILVVAFLAIVWGMVVLGQLAAPSVAFWWVYGSSLRVGVLFTLVGLGIVAGGGIGLAGRNLAPRLILLPVFAMLGALSIVLSTAEIGTVDYFVVMTLLSVNAGTALYVLMAAGGEYSIRGRRANTFILSLCMALIGVIYLVFSNHADSGNIDLSGAVRKIGIWGLVLFVVLGSVYTVLPFLPKLNRLGRIDNYIPQITAAAR